MDEELIEIQRKTQQTPVPRAVIFNPGSLLDFSVWFMVLWCGLVTTFMIPMMIRTATANFGRTTTAEVISTRSWVSTGKGGRTYNHYAATVAFPLPEKTYKAEAKISESLFDQTGRGDKISVKYIAGFEQYLYIDVDADGGSIIFLLVVLGVIVYAAWEIRERFELIKTGTPVIGDVIHIRRGNKGAIYWTVDYKIGKEPFEKEFGGNDTSTEQVLVIADPENPKRARLIDGKYPWKLAED